MAAILLFLKIYAAAFYESVTFLCFFLIGVYICHEAYLVHSSYYKVYFVFLQHTSPWQLSGKLAKRASRNDRKSQKIGTGDMEVTRRRICYGVHSPTGDAPAWQIPTNFSFKVSEEFLLTEILK